MKTLRVAGLSLLVATLGLIAPGCPSYTSFVETDTALGRVVVYRNGIAYYERRAKVQESTITLEVPADKVDDFLKSLTVTDARTGKTLPVSYPTRGASRGRTVEMTIQLPGKGPHDAILTYITEAPAWKPSYRVVVDKLGKVKVQGWAIVDNTSGENWKGVKVGVGSSSALSFRYDLRSVRTVHRTELHDKGTFATAPPTGGSIHTVRTGTGKKDAKVAGRRGPRIDVTWTDSDIPRNSGHPDLNVDGDIGGEMNKTATKGGEKAAGTALRARRLAQNQRAEGKVRRLAAQLNKRSGNVVIEGLRRAGEREGRAKATDRANMLRNKLIKYGVAPARLRVVTRKAAAHEGSRVRVMEEGVSASDSAAAGQPVGESHFESKIPMTVAKGTSAMVSIFQKSADGDQVYLYKAGGERGNDRYAFKAVRFKNPTDSTLETGPVTVYGSSKFIGEGLTDPIPPNATAIIPYALDRQVVVDRDGSTGDRISRLITLQRGILTAEVQHTRKTLLKITNRLHTNARVFIQHRVRKGWQLVDNPELYEKMGESHLFSVSLGKGETKTVTIAEATPMRQTVDLRSSIGVGLVKVFLRDGNPERRFAEPMKKLLAVWAEMAKHRDQIASLRERSGEFRTRMDELHTQIVSLKSVKTGGSLMKHLQKKLKEVNDRIQQATIDIVNHQEKLMLARIKFQDGVSELTLKPTVKASKTTK